MHILSGIGKFNILKVHYAHASFMVSHSLFSFFNLFSFDRSNDIILHSWHEQFWQRAIPFNWAKNEKQFAFTSMRSECDSKIDWVLFWNSKIYEESRTILNGNLRIELLISILYFLDHFIVLVFLKKKKKESKQMKRWHHSVELNGTYTQLGKLNIYWTSLPFIVCQCYCGMVWLPC